MTPIYLVAGVVGAFVLNSLARLSGAAHVMTDVATLAIALLAIRIGQHPADDRRTFGYKRFEILAAAFNAPLVFAVAILRAGGGGPAVPRAGGRAIPIVATIGLVVNLISLRLPTAGKDACMNVKGASCTRHGISHFKPG